MATHTHTTLNELGWGVVEGGQVLAAAVEILLVLLPFTLESVRSIAVVAATLAVGADVEAGFHQGQWVHAQHLVDLTEG